MDGVNIGIKSTNGLDVQTQGGRLRLLPGWTATTQGIRGTMRPPQEPTTEEEAAARPTPEPVPVFVAWGFVGIVEVARG